MQIVGEKNAAKYLNCSRMTIHNLRKKGLIPDPISEIKIASKTLRIWTSEQLDKVKSLIKKQGRPKVQ